MKKKMSTYLLLVLVIGVWGYVIFQVVAAVQDGQQVSPSTARVVKHEIPDMDYYTLMDTLPLQLDYRDPIFDEDGTLYRDDTAETIDEQPAGDIMPHFVEEHIMPEPEPDVHYLGFIENEKSKKQVAIVAIQGRQYMLAQHEQQQGITITQIAPDYIKVKSNGQTKTIFK